MTEPVRIPDVDKEDRILANLTARQVAILVVVGLVLYTGWTTTRSLLPLPVFLIAAVSIGVVAAVLVLGQRDGLSLDRLLLAALRQRLAPRHRISAPEGIHPVPSWLAARATPAEPDAAPEQGAGALALPASGVSEAGVVDLGPDGFAIVAVCGTVNFALRTPAEQESLVAGFARYLHSLTAAVQVLVRCDRLDLSGQITEVLDAAPSLPDPALEQAARDHADFLTHLARTADLLRRQVLLILREPLIPDGAVRGLGSLLPSGRQRGQPNHAVRRAAEARLVRRLGEASDLLATIGITVTALDSEQATGVLAVACNPDSLLPSTASLAGPDEIITSPAAQTDPYFSNDSDDRGFAEDDVWDGEFESNQP